MEKLRSFTLGLMAAVIVTASLGFGILVVGFAMVLGALLLLALKLSTLNFGRARRPVAEPEGHADATVA